MNPLQDPFILTISILFLITAIVGVKIWVDDWAFDKAINEYSKK